MIPAEVPSPIELRAMNDDQAWKILVEGAGHCTVQHSSRWKYCKEFRVI